MREGGNCLQIFSCSVPNTLYVNLQQKYSTRDQNQNMPLTGQRDSWETKDDFLQAHWVLTPSVKHAVSAGCNHIRLKSDIKLRIQPI